MANEASTSFDTLVDEPPIVRFLIHSFVIARRLWVCLVELPFLSGIGSVVRVDPERGNSLHVYASFCRLLADKLVNERSDHLVARMMLEVVLGSM